MITNIVTMPISQILGALAGVVGLAGVIYCLIKNERDLRKNLEKEIQELMKQGQGRLIRIL